MYSNCRFKPHINGHQNVRMFSSDYDDDENKVLDQNRSCCNTLAYFHTMPLSLVTLHPKSNNINRGFDILHYLSNLRKVSPFNKCFS